MNAPVLTQTLFGAEIHSPVFLASGTCGYGQEYADLIPLDDIGGIFTKAVSVEPRTGNPPHRVAETPGGMINAIGLENVGLDVFVAEKLAWLRDHLSRAHVFVNVVGRTAEEYAAVVSGLDPHEGFLGYEINVSCPNVKGGTMFGTDESALADLVAVLRRETDRPLIIKLTPNVADVGIFARICEEQGADGLSAINTFPGMLIDVHSRTPLIGNRSGGVSGPAILPMGVYATWRARQVTEIPIIGIGGIRNGEDAIQYMLAGAALVQVGTASFVDPDAAVTTHEGIRLYMERHGIAHLDSLVGSLIDSIPRMTGTRGLVDRASALFAEWRGEDPIDVSPVAGDGSGRRYWRLTGPDGTTALGAYGPDRDENRAFVSFSRTFREIGLPVPELYVVDEPAGVWLLEDLGDLTLFETLKTARGPFSDEFPDAMLPLYRRVLDDLPRFQVEGGRAIDFRAAYPRAAFDRQSILWDLNYFKYHFLKLARVPFSEARLETDFGRLARFLLTAETGHFLYRDFQSRNVMVREGEEGAEPWFIDYQGGRRGALQYDVASFLYDAKANLGDRQRIVLLDHYTEALGRHHEIDRAVFLETWPGYVLVRILQALGAYGYRGFFERKPRFLQSVPYAAHNLAGLLEVGLPVDVPELREALERIVDRWTTEADPSVGSDSLTVATGSFRFSGGYPQDTSGHGGGYVFDCRGLTNPGREEQYRNLTGLDRRTVEFLEGRPEVEAFWERVRTLVDSHVAEYQARGFSQLSVYFGCTGGQHRSVYFSERLAAHLRADTSDVEVSVVHRESADWPRAEGS